MTIVFDKTMGYFVYSASVNEIYIKPFELQFKNGHAELVSASSAFKKMFNDAGFRVKPGMTDKARSC